MLTSLLCSVMLLSAPGEQAAHAQPVPLVYDTDMGNDVDDGFALGVIHALQSRGECELLAVTVTKDHPLAGPFVDLLNTYYGRGDIPVGVVRNGVAPEKHKFLGMAEETNDSGQRVPHDLLSGENAPEATVLLRKTLAAQADGAVVIVQVGFSTNLARLLDTPPDEHSPLNGRDLVAQKVRVLSMMAGAFEPHNGAPHREYNVVIDIPSAQKLVKEWPTKIVHSGFEIGLKTALPKAGIREDFRYDPEHPMRVAYGLYNKEFRDQPSWDLTSVLWAVRPDRGYFDLSEPGHVAYDDEGYTQWTADPGGNQCYLKVNDTQIARVQEILTALTSEPPHLGGAEVSADTRKTASIDTSGFNDGIAHWQKKYGRDRNDPRFTSDQVAEISENILRYQNADGGWPKNLDYLADIAEADVRALRGHTLNKSTLDNRTTYSQINYLARAYGLIGDERYRESAERGLDFVVAGQHEKGGWRGADVDAITFNDGVMTGIMTLLLDIREGAPRFNWLDEARRKAATQSLDRAIDCALNCQIEVAGIKTGWCQQHDHETFAPVKARSYELASICAPETDDVLRFLMRLPSPDARVRDAVDCGVAWLKTAQINGIRIDNVPIEPVRFENHTATFDRVVVEDPGAPPIWARYYEIETNRPFFCNRDGVKVYTLAEVALERRTGYGWYSGGPATLFANDYPLWRARLGIREK